VAVELFEITWKYTSRAQDDIAEVRAEMGYAEYRADIRRLRLYLCAYFNGDDGCMRGLGKSVRCLGATAKGGKKLKVRWATPNCGKSGGLRIAVTAFCDERLVVLTRMWVRKDDPDEDEFSDAGDAADEYTEP